MIIDFHVHCFPDELAQKAVPMLAERAGVPALLDGTVADVKKSMKKAGIDCSVMLPIATKPTQTEKLNNWSAGIQGDGIVSFGSIHPEYRAWRSELDRIKSLGLKGIKFHPDYQGFYVDDPGMFPVYEYILSLDLIIVFHAGLDIGLPPPYHCVPERMLKVVEAFPGAKIVASHLGGFSYWDDVERFLVGKDLYFDTSYTLGHISREQAKRIITGHDTSKILFATDSPWADQGEEIVKIRELGLDTATEKAILGDNARRLLGLKED